MSETEKPIGRKDFMTRAPAAGYSYWKNNNDVIYANYLKACELWTPEVVNAKVFSKPGKKGVFDKFTIWGILLQSGIEKIGNKSITEVNETTCRNKVAELIKADKAQIGDLSKNKLLRVKEESSARSFKIGEFMKLINDNVLKKEGFNFF